MACDLKSTTLYIYLRWLHFCPFWYYHNQIRELNNKQRILSSILSEKDGDVLRSEERSTLLFAFPLNVLVENLNKRMPRCQCLVMHNVDGLKSFVGLNNQRFHFWCFNYVFYNIMA